MLNLMMTHSTRMAAMCTNKRLGEEVLKDPAVVHRLAWLRRSREARPSTANHAAEGSLRERTA
jgi:hypothetical protein